MNTKQAERLAAKQSKTEGAQYVVWVFDQGREIFTSEQARRYVEFISVESVFINGVKCADGSVVVA